VTCGHQHDPHIFTQITMPELSSSTTHTSLLRLLCLGFLWGAEWGIIQMFDFCKLDVEEAVWLGLRGGRSRDNGAEGSSSFSLRCYTPGASPGPAPRRLKNMLYHVCLVLGMAHVSRLLARSGAG